MSKAFWKLGEGEEETKRKDEAKGMKKVREGLRAELLRSEVAREKTEVEWKTLVEQRDKWRIKAEKSIKEKDKIQKDLRHELRAAKLTARKAQQRHLQPRHHLHRLPTQLRRKLRHGRRK